MFDSPPISQLSLIRLNTEKTLSAPKCVVFCPLNGSLKKFELSVDDRTTVLAIISETINLLSEINASLKAKGENQFNLYACKKNGRKCSDLPSFE